MIFKIASVDALLIEFGTTISQEISEKIRFYQGAIQRYDEVIDVTPSYTTLLITYDIFATSYDALIKKIQTLVYQKIEETNLSSIVKIPVYYGKEVGWDTQRVATLHHLTIEELISLHTSQMYTVYAIGFAPGFAYLGEVNKKIATPRLQTPRKMVPKGAVGIADTQTAIYPNQSPGGWNILGCTTFNMFDKNLEGLCPVQMGDKVQFYSISKEEFIHNGGIIE